MTSVEVTVRENELKQLGADIEKAKRRLLGTLAERGYQILRKEVPFRTGNLQQGVAPPDVDYEAMTATLTVSARSAAIGSRTAEVFGKDGKLKKKVTLRPRPAFNYAETVAKGRPGISPKNGRALLIPVYSRPAGEGYLMSDGQYFVVRRSASAVAANPFDERTAKQLDDQAANISEAVLKRFFK